MKKSKLLDLVESLSFYHPSHINVDIGHGCLMVSTVYRTLYIYENNNKIFIQSIHTDEIDMSRCYGTYENIHDGAYNVMLLLKWGYYPGWLYMGKSSKWYPCK